MKIAASYRLISLSQLSFGGDYCVMYELSVQHRAASSPPVATKHKLICIDYVIPGNI